MNHPVVGHREQRLSVVQFSWSDDAMFQRLRIDRMLFDDFFALMPRVDSPHHREGPNASDAISGSC